MITKLNHNLILNEKKVTVQQKKLLKIWTYLRDKFLRVFFYLTWSYHLYATIEEIESLTEKMSFLFDIFADNLLV